MREYIRALRLRICLSAGLLTIASYKVSGVINGWLLPALTVIFIASATMAYNDYRDRFNDFKKGKCLAFRNPNNFFLYAMFLWAVAISFSFLLWKSKGNMAIISALMIFSGFVYSETRRIPMIPILLVSITSASAALFPIFIGQNKRVVYLLFLITTLIIFSREIIKDLEDADVDNNYKWTLPLAIGVNGAKILAGIILFSSVILIIATKSFVYFTGIPFFLFSVFFLLKNNGIRIVKTFLDIGMTIILISILLSNF